MTDENENQDIVTLEEVTLLPVEKEVPDEETRENPISISKYTAGITWQGVAGGVAGMVVSAAVPKAVKMNDGGWKEIATTAVTAVGGGYLLKKFVDKQAGLGFVIGGLSVATLQAIRKFTGKSASLVGDVGANDELIYGDGGYFMGDVGDDIFSEDDLFGIDDDPIVPTAGIDDF